MNNKLNFNNFNVAVKYVFFFICVSMKQEKKHKKNEEMKKITSPDQYARVSTN